MKKSILTLALLTQFVFAMATDKKAVLAQPLQENVKVFLQAGTSTAIVEVLSTNDRVEVIRRHNKLWDIVSINGKVGYVLHAEITQLKDKAEN